MNSAKRLALLTTIAICASAIASPRKLSILPSHQQVLTHPGLTRAAIGNPEIADIRVIAENAQVVVFGKRRGQTNLTLWSEDGSKQTYAIYVGPKSPQVQQEARSYISGIEDLRLNKEHGKLVLSGRLVKPSDLRQVAQLKHRFPNLIDHTSFHPASLKALVSEIQQRLYAAGFSQVRVQGFGKEVFVEGSVYGSLDTKKVKSLVETVHPLAQYDLKTRKGLKDTLFLQLQFLEVKKDALTRLGLDWPESVTWAQKLSVGESLARTSGGISDRFDVTLHALKNNGSIKVLSEPTILVRDENKARFHAGGEFPIRLTGERVAQVQFKKFGFDLSFDVQTIQADFLHVDLDAKISALDQALSVDGIPGLIENTVQTSVDVKMNETAIVAGLMTQMRGKSVRKVPLLGQIPILGELFKSRAFQRNETEFLLFFTPRRRSAQDIRDDFDRRQNLQKKLNTDMRANILD